MPKLLVLGDDLTGSNATGALYARFGLRAVSVNAPLTPDAPCLRAETGIDALVVNLGTRHASSPHAAQAVREAIDLVGPGELTVKPVEVVEAVLRPPAGIVVCDATTNRHLTTVARATARLAVDLGGLRAVRGRPIDAGQAPGRRARPLSRVSVAKPRLPQSPARNT